MRTFYFIFGRAIVNVFLTQGYSKMLKSLQTDYEDFELYVYDPNGKTNPCMLLNKLKHWGEFATLTWSEWYELNEFQKKNRVLKPPESPPPKPEDGNNINPYNF